MLMGLVLILGVQFAALCSAEPVSIGYSLNLAAAVLIFASFAARFAGDASRAWWFGFALLGWSQFVLAMVIRNSYGINAAMPPTNWITLELMNWGFSARRPSLPADPDLPMRFDDLRDIFVSPHRDLLESLYLKSNATVSLLVGAVGGAIAHCISVRQMRRPAPNPPVA